MKHYGGVKVLRETLRGGIWLNGTIRGKYGTLRVGDIR